MAMKNYFMNLYRGRISRRNYFFGSFIVLLPYGIIGSTLESVKTPWFIYTPYIIIGLILVYAWLISLFVRRLHDINWGGSSALLGFVPFVNIIFSIFLTFAPPKNVGNEFGEYKNRRFSIKQIFGF